MKKHRNIIFLITFIFFCVFVFYFNYFLNPYNIKQYAKHNFDIMHSPRSLLSTFLKQSKDIKYKHVVLGASATYHLFLTDMFLCKTNEPIARLVVPAFSSKKLYELLVYFLDMHPEVENVYVALENYAYLMCNNYDDFEIKNTSRLQDLINLYFSVDATKLSFKKFIHQHFFLDKQNILSPNMNDNSFLVYPKRKYVTEYNESCLTSNLHSLKKIKVLLDSKNIKSTFFIPPTHSLYLGDLYIAGNLYKYENLKREYAKIVDFYDMGFVNKLTTQPFNWMWQDVMHLNSFSNMDIYDVLVDKKESDIAMFITSENIEEILKQQENLIKSFVVQNIDMVKEYSIFEHDESRRDFYAKKNYFKDVPEKYDIKNFCPMEKVKSIEKSLGI